MGHLPALEVLCEDCDKLDAPISSKSLLQLEVANNNRRHPVAVCQQCRLKAVLCAPQWSPELWFTLLDMAACQCQNRCLQSCPRRC